MTSKVADERAVDVRVAGNREVPLGEGRFDEHVDAVLDLLSRDVVAWAPLRETPLTVSRSVIPLAHTAQRQELAALVAACRDGARRRNRWVSFRNSGAGGRSAGDWVVGTISRMGTPSASASSSVRLRVAPAKVPGVRLPSASRRA